MSNCKGCAYQDSTGCMILNTSESCGNIVSFEEAQKREVQCDAYARERREPFEHGRFKKFFQRTSQIHVRFENKKKRGCTVKEALDKQYDELHEKGMSDGEIAKMLYMAEITLRNWKRERRKNESGAI